VDVYAIGDGVEKVVVPGATVRALLLRENEANFLRMTQASRSMSERRITLHLVSFPSYLSFDSVANDPNQITTGMSYMNEVGSEPLEELAGRIWTSVGPSGPNKVGIP
jgi:hypothetical protein